MLPRNFKELLALALAEDLGEEGDVTSRAIFGEERCRARLLSKDAGVLCGVECFEAVFRARDPGCAVERLAEDGAALRPGDAVAAVEGRTLSVLEAERTAINFVSFMSGIATAARAHAEAARKAGRAVILDTRKTLPGYRDISKYAVRTGGGTNHRMGLHDMVMIKDNHVDAAGGISRAVGAVRAKWGARFRIEVETRNLDEVAEALALGVDVIMLDNMDSASCARAVALGAGRVKFEASGNMDMERIAAYSAAGVDYISIGKLTHSVKAFDFSLAVERGR